ncbi:MAG TPA: glycoside hydrolase family 127 protein [Puia sp.]|nr:glycoside hydrolase family 127 protein [Puia sp.]
MLKIFSLIAGVMIMTQAGAQSKHTVLKTTILGEVHWTTGFWADRFAIVRDSMIPGLWRTYTDPNISHAFKNFEIAAGLDTGSHIGPPFHDGDFYKLLEGMAAVYAMTKDRRLDSLMDKAINVIARAQKPNGYIHTPTLIEERNHPGKTRAFEDRLNFETYNMGHLMTAACVHYKATGKKSFLALAIKAANYLDSFYRRSSPELARNAICPSHYMGIVELYRTTGNPEYLRLAQNLIDIRGLVDNGTDDNQDRVPFRRQTTAMGHAVRANYLYAGVADLYAETGEDSLWYCLDKIWHDVVERKLYITGACGALYDGVSPDATSYNPAEIQEVHQAYGRAYQLPNTTAHNETCANIGNVLWNWRMLLASGKAQYADALEQSLYNSVLSGASLDGERFFYTNPLRSYHSFPYQLRWEDGRQPYIALSNCCPPNLGRTLAEVAGYMYCISEKGLWVNLYGGNRLSTSLEDGSSLRVIQKTEYPWDGKIVLTLQQAPSKDLSIFLRIPGWCKNASLRINGKATTNALTPGTYAEVHRTWKKGDIITLEIPMPAELITANPMVEETRGQIAVRRGPVVYCLESPDLPRGTDILRIAMPLDAGIKPLPMHIGKSRFMGLATTAKVLPDDTGRLLYREVSRQPARDVPVTLIPYYAWANRGQSDMTVWMELIY